MVQAAGSPGRAKAALSLCGPTRGAAAVPITPHEPVKCRNLMLKPCQLQEAGTRAPAVPPRPGINRKLQRWPFNSLKEFQSGGSKQEALSVLQGIGRTRPSGSLSFRERFYEPDSYISPYLEKHSHPAW